MEIFQNSVSQFFQEKYSHARRMKIEYVVNDYLNVIYPSKINRNDLVDLVSEFKYHPKAYRWILQSAYTFLAIRWPLETITSSDKIVISMPISAKEKWVFIPGNHSIRVIDLDENRCFVFLKSEFNNKFIEFSNSYYKKNGYQELVNSDTWDYVLFWYEVHRLEPLSS